MLKADRVLATPHSAASSSTLSAPGAVQFSSPLAILTSDAHAGQGVRNEPQPSSGSGFIRAGL